MQPAWRHAARAQILRDVFQANALDELIASAEQDAAVAAVVVERATVDHNLVRQRLEQLRTLQQTLRTSSDALRRTLSTVSTLPPEVLTLCFSLAVRGTSPTLDFDEELADMDDIKLARDLSLVSKRFRQLALATPALWNRIVVPSRMRADAEDVFYTYVREQLERSLALPIDVNILFGGEPEDIFNTSTARTNVRTPISVYVDVLGQLADHTRRLRSFHFSGRLMPCEDLSGHVFEDTAAQIEEELGVLLRRRLPKLTDLAIAYPHPSYNLAERLDRQWRTPCLCDAPRLVRLSLQELPFPVCGGPDAAGAFPDLTHLSANQADGNETALWTMVSRAPRLRILETYGAFKAVATPGDRPATLPLLESLLVNDKVTALLFLQPPNGTRVDLPRLAELCLDYDCVGALHGLNAATSSPARTVTRVRIRGGLVGDWAPARALAGVEDAVYDLLDADEMVADGFWDALCDGADPLWPRLRSLTVKRYQWRDEPPDGVLRLARARNVRGATGRADDFPRALERVDVDVETAPLWIQEKSRDILGAALVISEF